MQAGIETQLSFVLATKHNETDQIVIFSKAMTRKQAETMAVKLRKVASPVYVINLRAE